MAVILMFLGSLCEASAQKCLKYEQPVSLTGKLYSRIFAGPPNWKSIRKGDSREKAWLVSLNRKICTIADGSDNFNVSERGIVELQLVIKNKKHWRVMQSSLGKQVRLVGTLFHGHSGYHRTQVLIDVSDIKAAK